MQILNADLSVHSCTRQPPDHDDRRKSEDQLYSGSSTVFIECMAYTIILSVGLPGLYHWPYVLTAGLTGPRHVPHTDVCRNQLRPSLITEMSRSPSRNIGAGYGEREPIAWWY